MAIHHGETPSMSAANYSNSSYATGQLMGGAAFISNSTREAQPDYDALTQLVMAQEQARRGPRHHSFFHAATKEETPAMPARRIVQVYIADPSDAVPLEDSILYTGEQKMTDLTDQELFFEIDIKTILEAHNVVRRQIVNKLVKDRTEYLENAKVRDLKMVVVTVASF